MSDTTLKNQDDHPDFINLLLARNIITQEQSELIKADCIATGISAEEVVLARRWVKPEDLLDLAPWLKGKPRRLLPATRDPKVYQENLDRYRELIDRILDRGGE
jgi:hypothetical protein